MDVTEHIEFQDDGGSVHTWITEDGKVWRREVFKVSPCLFMPWPLQTANERGIAFVDRVYRGVSDQHPYTQR